MSGAILSAMLWQGSIPQQREAVRMIRASLVEHRNVTRAARELGVGRATLNRWLDQMPELRAGLDLAPGAPEGNTNRRGTGAR